VIKHTNAGRVGGAITRLNGMSEISVDTVLSDCDLRIRQFRLEFASVVNMCWWCVLCLGLVLGLGLKIKLHPLLPDWSGTGAFAIGLSEHRYRSPRLFKFLYDDELDYMLIKN
jgi:hypothetical protein